MCGSLLHLAFCKNSSDWRATQAHQASSDIDGGSRPCDPLPKKRAVAKSHAAPTIATTSRPYVCSGHSYLTSGSHLGAAVWSSSRLRLRDLRRRCPQNDPVPKTRDLRGSRAWPAPPFTRQHVPPLSRSFPRSNSDGEADAAATCAGTGHGSLADIRRSRQTPQASGEPFHSVRRRLAALAPAVVRRHH